MSVLMWIAVLVGAWCVASVVAALVLGAFLRRRGRKAATRIEMASRLETGPLRMWLAEMPEAYGPVVPDTAESLLRDVPGPRTAGDDVAPAWAESTDATRG